MTGYAPLPTFGGVPVEIIESDVPKYQQLADILRRRILSGEIQPRHPLPSKKQLMQEFGISAGTVDRAVRVLRGEGLVHSVIGLGIYVRSREDWP
jgi:DNA-binding GntR family transcriptional regulator